MTKVFAFVDESGNHDLNTEKPGTGQYCIVLAILVKEESLATLRDQAEVIRKKYFHAGEMKSSSVRDTDGYSRRIKILHEIGSLDFKFYAVAIDKAAVYRDRGLQHKKSFLKFVNGLLYRQLFQNYQDISIHADAHGRQEFIESFKSYIHANHKPDLFWRSQIEIVQSQNDVLIQLADMVVGSLGKQYAGKSNPQLTETILAVIKDKALRIDAWPTKYQLYNEEASISSEADLLIRKHALAKAEIFLNENVDRDDEEIRMQYITLAYLLFINRFEDDRDYVPTYEILGHLQQNGFHVTEQVIRSSIVAKLRDSGVLIASCSKGYKIPKRYSDVRDFVERVNSLVLPLLERLKKAQDSFSMASHGEINILRGAHYQDLQALVQQLDK
jgi:hypothetical protein